MNRKLIYINFAVIALLALGLVYLVFQNDRIMDNIAPSTVERAEQSQSPQPSPEFPVQTPNPSPKTLTLQDTQAAILDLTNDTAREPLKEYMAEQISVLLYATECCQPMSKTDAIEQIDYINEGLPITFDQNNTTIVNLKAKNPQLANTYIGISQTKEHSIAFTIDPATNKITKIKMSVSWKLY